MESRIITVDGKPIGANIVVLYDPIGFRVGCFITPDDKNTIEEHLNEDEKDLPHRVISSDDPEFASKVDGFLCVCGLSPTERTAGIMVVGKFIATNAISPQYQTAVEQEEKHDED